MNIKLLKAILFLSIILIFSSCGGGSSSQKDGNTTEQPQGSGLAYFIDSAVGGLSYVGTSGVSGKTDTNGRFAYDGNSEIKFYTGNAYIGKIDSTHIKRDKKVFIQDIVGVDRAKTFDAKVLKIARVLQSLDDDGDLDNGINIKKEIKREVSISDLSTSEISTVLQEVEATLIPKTRAISHLNSVLKKEVGLNPFNDTSVDRTKPIKPTITYPQLEYDSYFIGNERYRYFVDNSPKITVNGEIETEVSINDIPQNAFIDVDDNISVTLEANGNDGYYEYSVKLIDNSSNKSEEQIITLIKETTPPVTPIFVTQPVSLINTNSISVDIQSPLNIWEQNKGVEIWTRTTSTDWTKYHEDMTSDGNATITFNTSSLIDSDETTFSIKLIDKFLKKSISNRTSAILNFNITKDLMPPSAPVRVGNDPIVTNNNTFEVKLLAEKNSKIIYKHNGVNDIVGTVPNSCGGNSECQTTVVLTFPSSNDANYQFNLYAQDIAGNFSNVALVLSASKDSNIPNPPVLNLHNGNLELYTNDANNDDKELIELSCSKVGCESEHYSIFIDDVDSGYDLDGNGKYSFDFDLTVGDGVKVYSIRFVDNVGRSSSPVTLTLKKDSSIPTVPVLITQIPNNNTTTENNITIKIKATESDLDVLIAGVPQSITTDSNFEAELFLNIGSIDTTRNFAIAFKDKAKNISPTLTVTMTRDTTIPALPIITFIEPSLFSFTNKNSIILKVEGEAGADILIGGHKLDPNVQIGNGGSANITLLTSGADGSYSYDISLSDIVGNTSGVITKSVIKDTIAPGVPSIATIPSHTNEDVTSVLLTGEAGTSIFINGVDTNLVIEPTGQKVFDLDTSGADGEKLFEITLRDYALNFSGKLNFIIIKDTVPPSPLAFTTQDIPTHTTIESVDVEVIGDASEAGNKIFIDTGDTGLVDTGLILNVAGKTIVTLDTSGTDYGSKEFNIVQQDKAGNNSLPLRKSIFKTDKYLYIESTIWFKDRDEIKLYFSAFVTAESYDNDDQNNDFSLEGNGTINQAGPLWYSSEAGYKSQVKFGVNGMDPYYFPKQEDYPSSSSNLKIDYTYKADIGNIEGAIEDNHNIPPPLYAKENIDGIEVEIKAYEANQVKMYKPIIQTGQTISYNNAYTICEVGEDCFRPIDLNMTYNRDDGACRSMYGTAEIHQCYNAQTPKNCVKDSSVVRCHGSLLVWQDDTGETVLDSEMDYDTARSYCLNLSLDGHNDWRLPTINELITISDKGRYDPSIDGAFSDYPTGDKYYWSKTKYIKEAPFKYWIYGIQRGNTFYLETDAPKVYTKCVRGLDLSL